MEGLTMILVVVVSYVYILIIALFVYGYKFAANIRNARNIKHLTRENKN